MTQRPAAPEPPPAETVLAAWEAVRLAVREHDRELDRMQGEDAERHVMPLVDEFIRAIRVATLAEVRAAVEDIKKMWTKHATNCRVMSIRVGAGPCLCGALRTSAALDAVLTRIEEMGR